MIPSPISVPAPSHASARPRLLLPETVRSDPVPGGAESGALRIRWPYALSIASVHVLALLACWPWFFSWTALFVCGLSVYLFGTLGINVGFHRLLTHRSFACSKRLEHALALLGACCLQEGPARWVAIHRRHHQHSDHRPDPHSPLVAFLWGHVGWLLVANSDTDALHLYQRYARDLLTQRFYLRLERRLTWLWVYLAHALLIGAAAILAARLAGLDWPRSLQLAAGVLVWGVLVRTVLVWHITWSVNSLSHLFGYQSHPTGENSRNNWLVALISNGEGWHNNHHHDPCSAAHGRSWRELDVSYLTILALEALGLARKVLRPDRRDAHLTPPQ